MFISSAVQQNSHSNFWGTEDMSSLSGLPPLDIDPLPSLFPFSPCGGGSYKYEYDYLGVINSSEYQLINIRFRISIDRSGRHMTWPMFCYHSSTPSCAPAQILNKCRANSKTTIIIHKHPCHTRCIRRSCSRRLISRNHKTYNTIRSVTMRTNAMANTSHRHRFIPVWVSM